MPGSRSKQKFFEFLDYLATKGLVGKSTIDGRRAAATKVFDILSDEEAADITKLELDDVMRRFQNLQGQNYTPGSLNTYLSRLRSAVEDFDSYVKNPLGFKPNVQTRERRPKGDTKRSDEAIRSTEKRGSESDRQGTRSVVEPTNSIIPIPIRPDLTVYIQGIPYDLTDAEAGKIANVIRAMAMSG